MSYDLSDHYAKDTPSNEIFEMIKKAPAGTVFSLPKELLQGILGAAHELGKNYIINKTLEKYEKG